MIHGYDNEMILQRRYNTEPLLHTVGVCLIVEFVPLKMRLYSFKNEAKY